MIFSWKIMNITFPNGIRYSLTDHIFFIADLHSYLHGRKVCVASNTKGTGNFFLWNTLMKILNIYMCFKKKVTLMKLGNQSTNSARNSSNWRTHFQTSGAHTASRSCPANLVPFIHAMKCFLINVLKSNVYQLSLCLQFNQDLINFSQ